MFNSKARIYTFMGKTVNPLDLMPEDICIEDIAHSLALCNRFAGHTKFPISVAQHSVYVSRLVAGVGKSRRDVLQALLHDASESYLGDMTKWLKSTDAMRGYREAEADAQSTIYITFNCLQIEPDALEWADRVMVRFEGLKGCGVHFTIDHPRYPPLTEEEIALVGPWEPWEWERAEGEFLSRFRELQS